MRACASPALAMGITAELSFSSGAADRFDFAADLWPTRLDFAARFFLAAGNRRAIAFFVRPTRAFARRTKRFALPAFWIGFWRLPFALECVAKSCADEESPALRFALPLNDVHRSSTRADENLESSWSCSRKSTICFCKLTTS